METRKLAEGLWRWTAAHPDWRPEKDKPGGWKQMVGSVYYEPPSGQPGGKALVLIDPLAPREGTPEAEKFWGAMDADVRRFGRPVAILLGNFYHERSAQAFYERYRHAPGAEILAHEAARGKVSCPLTRTFQPGEPLPGGIEAYEVLGLEPEEVVYRLPPHHALVFSDSLVGTAPGRVQVPPESWAPEGKEFRILYHDSFRNSLRRLLDRPVEMLLVSHGDPIFGGGREALAAALKAPAWGE